MRIAIFDVDNTLLTGQSYSVLLPHLWRTGWRRWRLLALALRHLPRQLLRELRLVDSLHNQERWGPAMADLFRGVPVDEVQGLIRQCRPALLERVRPLLLQEIALRKEEGCLVLLASNSVAPLIEEIAALVGADAGVGTPLATAGGRYTGQMGGPSCNGERKLAYLAEQVGARWHEVDWPASFAYSDGPADLPMLEKVGHPVAVAPRQELGRIAAARGWRVVDAALS